MKNDVKIINIWKESLSFLRKKCEMWHLVAADEKAYKLKYMFVC